MKKSFIADSIINEYNRKKKFEEKIKKQKLVNFKEKNCTICKNKKTELCHIVKNIDNEFACPYKNI